MSTLLSSNCALLRLFAISSIGIAAANVAAEPFEKFYEHPDDVVVKAIYFHERCVKNFPKLRNLLDSAFYSFERSNKKYFDSTRMQANFDEKYLVFKENFESLEITEEGCNWVANIMKSPESKIK